MGRKLTAESKKTYEWYIEHCELAADINMLIAEFSKYQGDEDYRDLLQKALTKKEELYSPQRREGK